MVRKHKPTKHTHEDIADDLEEDEKDNDDLDDEDDEDDSEEFDTDEETRPEVKANKHLVKQVAQQQAPQVQVMERIIDLSLINDKLNFIIAKLNEK